MLQFSVYKFYEEFIMTFVKKITKQRKLPVLKEVKSALNIMYFLFLKQIGWPPFCVSEN